MMYPIEFNGRVFLPNGAMVEQPQPEQMICSQCGEIITAPALRSIATGYALGSDGEIVCYDCCAEHDKAQMRARLPIVLYVEWTRDSAEGLLPSRVMNWCGSLRLPISYWSRGSHNIARTRFDIWFKFDGVAYHGVNIGDNDILRCKALKPQPQPHRKHYIAGAGLHGYLYNCSEVFETRGAAAQWIGDIHELSQRAIYRLRRDCTIELDLSQHGNEYAEIIECECDDPNCHSENDLFGDI